MRNTLGAPDISRTLWSFPRDRFLGRSSRNVRNSPGTSSRSRKLCDRLTLQENIEPCPTVSIDKLGKKFSGQEIVTRKTKEGCEKFIFAGEDGNIGR